MSCEPCFMSNSQVLNASTSCSYRWWTFVVINDIFNHHTMICWYHVWSRIESRDVKQCKVWSTKLDRDAAKNRENIIHSDSISRSHCGMYLEWVKSHEIVAHRFCTHDVHHLQEDMSKSLRIREETMSNNLMMAISTSEISTMAVHTIKLVRVQFVQVVNI